MEYIVWNPKGTTPPRVTFGTREAAQTEAERLAGRHPGQTFHVCQLLSTSVADQVRTTAFTEDAPAAATAGTPGEAPTVEHLMTQIRDYLTSRDGLLFTPSGALTRGSLQLLPAPSPRGTAHAEAHTHPAGDARDA